MAPKHTNSKKKKENSGPESQHKKANARFDPDSLFGSVEVIPSGPGTKIYNIATANKIPDFLSDKKKRELRKNQNYQGRIELIQGFGFRELGFQIRASRNEEFLITTGGYPPLMKCFQLSQLSQHWERGLQDEPHDLTVLTDDFEKIAILRRDVNLDFHAKSGMYFSTTVPRASRTLLYNPYDCNLVISGQSSQIFRLNLEFGQFIPSLVSQMDQVFCSDYLSGSHLLAFGGDNGQLECWDSRNDKKSSIVKDVGITVNALQREEGVDLSDSVEVTAVKFADDGLTMGVGTNTGHVLLYDLRAAQPLITKDHRYGNPIFDLKFHEKKVISTDRTACKIWGRDTGEIHAAIEPPAAISSVYHFKESGLFTFACNTPNLLAYFIPSLGRAPRWCSFLDAMTEELEEDKQEIFDHFKFITKDEVQELGISKMIGTSYLRAHMHGYWINHKLYNKLRALANPLAYEEYKQHKIDEKIEEERKTRIGVTQKRSLPKVNASLATELLNNKKTSAIVSDPRFGALFSQSAFLVEEDDDAYRRLNRGKQKKPVSQTDIMQHFEGETDDHDNDQAEDNNASDSDDFDLLEEKKTRDKISSRFSKQTSSSAPRLYQVKTGHEHLLSASAGPDFHQHDEDQPFSQRLETKKFKKEK